jgi:xanthine dehydrogenase iron-sulfur cluster and FAD-binding subunit A
MFNLQRLKDESCPPADVEDILKAIDGNLCRCTGYRPIVEAFSTFCSVNEADPEKSGLKKYCPETDDPGDN